MSKWKTAEMVAEYAAKAVDPVTGWYEYEVNFPDLLRLIPNEVDTLLDFGCGPGEFTSQLLEKCKYVTGADTEAMLDLARANYPELDFVVWDGEAGPPREIGKFDVIFSKLTLQFIKDVGALAANFFDVLTDYGLVVFSVPHPDKIAKKFNLDSNTVTNYTDKIGYTGIEIYPIYRPASMYTNMFGKAGFELVETSEPEIPRQLMEKYNVSEEYAEQPHRLNLKFRKVID